MSDTIIKISDRGAALVALHTELERLGMERIDLIHEIKRLDMQCVRIERRAEVLHAAMVKIRDSGEFVYEEV